MLEAINSGNRQAFARLCASDNFGTRILSAYNYEQNDPASVFLLAQNAGGEPVGALYLRGFSATICGRTTEEMRDCLTFLGCQTVFCRERAFPIEKLSLQKTGFVARLTDTPPKPQQPIQFIDAESLRGIYPCLKWDLPESDRFPLGSWYVQLSHRLRHDTCHIAAVSQNGQAVSLALTAAETEKNAVIGCVRTLPDFRHRGYGSAVCAALCQTLSSLGKQVFLCAEDPLFSFYQPLGFTKIYTWWSGNI